MNSTMLLYVVFCCLILVQVKGKCQVTEFIKMLTNLNNRNELATCMIREFENLSFPTKWTGCKWSCLDKGLVNVTANFKPSASPVLGTLDKCARNIRRIEKMQMTFKRQICSSIRCEEHCEHTTGNIYEYLKEVIDMLQSIERNNARNAS